MNAETIELLKKVQDRKGEWRVFDPVLYRGERAIIMLIYSDNEMVRLLYENGSQGSALADDPDLLWLPPTAPGWNDDGRNLWAMVDWEKWGICVDENRRILIHERKYDIVYFEADTLPEALLRAIERKGE